MDRIYSFALGNVWRWTRRKNRSVLLRYIRDLGISGVELTFSSVRELHAFSLTESDLGWLRGLPYATIHAPFDLFEHADAPEIIRRLENVSKLYDSIGAKNVIVHPNRSESFSLLKGVDFKIVLENMPPKDGFQISDLKRYFSEFPDFSFCLDVSHAYLWSRFEASDLIDAFGDRMAQVHLSGTYRRKCHVSLRKVAPAFMESIRPLKSRMTPIVIEEDFEKRSERALADEVEYVKNWAEERDLS